LLVDLAPSDVRGLDRALLARRRRRAGAGVEAVVAAQPQEAPIPDHFVALAAGDDRSQVVVDALACDATEPVEDARVPLEERLDRHIQREERRLRTRVRRLPDQRVDAQLAAWLASDRGRFAAWVAERNRRALRGVLVGGADGVVDRPG
jgi:hypothetical protein